MNIIEVKNLCYTVSNKKFFAKISEKRILEDISFSVEKEKIIGIAGESGSGKTTLAKVLAGILTPSSGTVSINVAEEWKKRKTSPAQILFQNTGEILNPLREVNKVVDESIQTRFGYIDNVLKKEMLNAVNLDENLWKRKGFELSGGEQQRAAFVRLLAVQPEILILDEPFSAQDAASQLNLLNLFKAINQKFKITMICISHNLRLLHSLCDYIIILFNGRIVEQNITKNIFNNPQHPYTRFLLSAESYSLSYEEIKNELNLLKN